jgi:hypothetical protein
MLSEVNAVNALAGVCTAAFGAGAWLFRLDRRISVLERQDQVLYDWLGRIESKLDRAIERRRD